jgi:hypothetical protein
MRSTTLPPAGAILLRDRLAGALFVDEVDQRRFILILVFSGSNRPAFWLTMCFARSSMAGGFSRFLSHSFLSFGNEPAPHVIFTQLSLGGS